MKYQIKHLTKYSYVHPSVLGYNQVWITPLQLPFQEVLANKVEILPEASHFEQYQDFFGNTYGYFTIEESHTDLKITAHSTVIRTEPIVHRASSVMAWNKFRDELFTGEPSWSEQKLFMVPSPLVSLHQELIAYALPSFPEGRPMFEAVFDLMQRIYTEFEYKPDFTTISTPSLEVLQARKGVCQDFSHLAIGCLRSLGLPARYVSGYIETHAPEEGEQLEGTAASHAWFAAYIPELGWIDFDPTNNKLAGYQHISVAHGRDYSDIPPIKGVVYSGSSQTLSVAVDVKRLETS